MEKRERWEKIMSTEEELLEGQLSGSDTPGSCGMCQFFYELREDKGLGICLQKKELREECDANDLVNGTCKPLIRQPHLCYPSCKHDYPPCNGKPVFLHEHPKVDLDWVILRDRDTVWKCQAYKNRG